MLGSGGSNNIVYKAGKGPAMVERLHGGIAEYSVELVSKYCRSLWELVP